MQDFPKLDIDDFDLDSDSELDAPIFEAATAVAEEPDTEVAPLEDPVAFPAWRDSDDFESFIAPGGQQVVLSLDADADLGTGANRTAIAYWPAEFVVPVAKGEEIWDAPEALTYAQVTVEEAGEDYIESEVEWKTIERDEGVIELGRYERDEAEHVIVLLTIDGAQSVAFARVDDDDELFPAAYEFTDFDEAERAVVDMVF